MMGINGEGKERVVEPIGTGGASGKYDCGRMGQ